MLDNIGGTSCDIGRGQEYWVASKVEDVGQSEEDFERHLENPRR
jgi:hypothetical protein